MVKKVITLSIKDLRDLGIISDKKKKKKRRKQKRRAYLQPPTIGGIKSESSGMQGFSQYTPFTNTANIGTQIQLANLKAIENGTANPESRFPSANTTKLDDSVVDHAFNRLMAPYLERTGSEFDRINGTIDRGIQAFNSLQSQINKPPAINFSLDDNAGAFAETGGSDEFTNEGNNIPVDDVNAPAQIRAVDSSEPTSQIDQIDDNVEYEEVEEDGPQPKAPSILIKQLRSTIFDLIAAKRIDRRKIERITKSATKGKRPTLEKLLTELQGFKDK